MSIAKKVFHAEVILTWERDDPEYVFSEKDLLMAAIEAESKINALAYFDYEDGILAARVHLKGERNGDNQNKNMA